MDENPWFRDATEHSVDWYKDAEAANRIRWETGDTESEKSEGAAGKGGDAAEFMVHDPNTPDLAEDLEALMDDQPAATFVEWSIRCQEVVNALEQMITVAKAHLLKLDGNAFTKPHMEAIQSWTMEATTFIASISSKKDGAEVIDWNFWIEKIGEETKGLTRRFEALQCGRTLKP